MAIDWKRIEPTVIHKVGGYRVLTEKHFELPDGTTSDYVTMGKEGSHCIATLAMTADKKVILARQFRPGPERIMHELPGGGVEAGDTDFQSAAARELLEETGYVPGTIVPLGDTYKDSYTSTQWHYFLATDCTLDPAGPQPDAQEFIEVELVTVPELFRLARDRRMTDTEALFFAYDTLVAVQTNE